MNFCARYEAEVYNPVYIYLGEPVEYSYGGENLPKKGKKRNSEKRFRPLTHMFLKLLRFLNYQKEIMLFKRDPFAAKLYARRSSENLRSKIYHSISFLI